MATKKKTSHHEPEQPKRAVIYTRVSRDDSGEGRSNARQREDCEKLADLRGWTVVEVCEDISISAYSGKKRPGWEAALAMVKAGEVDLILAWRLDRMTRSLSELERLIVLAEDHGVGIATVVGDIDLMSETGRMIARILASVARYEVEMKAARQRAANRQRAAEGLPRNSGFRAMGYTMDGEVIEAEAEVIRDAVERVLNGKSLKSITRHWQDSGVPTPRSKTGTWRPRAIKQILINPRYAGIATHDGEVLGRGQWQPIISEQTHIELVALLTDPNRLTRQGGSRGRQAENLLTGLARCASCDQTVVAGSKQGRMVYRCPNDHLSTPRGEADEAVRNAVAMTVAVTRPGAVVPTRKPGQDAALWAEAERLRERLNGLSASYAADRIDLDQLESASKVLRDQLADIENRLTESVASPESPYTLRAESVTNFLDGDLAEQRRVLANLARITLYPRGRGRRNVPIKHQVTVELRVNSGRKNERWITALDERPKVTA